jgi:hypothetical protein
MVKAAVALTLSSSMPAFFNTSLVSCSTPPALVCSCNRGGLHAPREQGSTVNSEPITGSGQILCLEAINFRAWRLRTRTPFTLNSPSSVPPPIESQLSSPWVEGRVVAPFYEVLLKDSGRRKVGGRGGGRAVQRQC